MSAVNDVTGYLRETCFAKLREIGIQKPQAGGVHQQAVDRLVSDLPRLDRIRRTLPFIVFLGEAEKHMRNERVNDGKTEV